MRTLILAIATLLFVSYSNGQNNTIKKTENMYQETEHYTFELSENVTREKVTFKNRYGITLTGDLYSPKNKRNKKLPALATSGPYGAVKEQSSGLYANQLAQRGFVVVAFDPSFTGESGGKPRNVASPEIFTEDLSATIDFLGTLSYVDRNRVGIMGICGFGGFALNAAAVDKRVKAVAVASMYDMSRVTAKGYFDSVNPEQRTQMLEQLSQQRWADAENGEPAYSPAGLPSANQLTGEEPEFVQGYVSYYKTERGFHPRSINSNGSWTMTTPISLMNMPIMTYIEEISPRPILVIAGENAHSKYFSEDAIKAAAEPKELMIIPNAVHTDLYDKIDVIPFAKLEVFFKENLK
ncbi:alpha/beta hydrolase [Tenacibaculum larymnensis]|uniref:Alpha/beta hydrolase n=1 Tax=Tenacibaculum larymnensis TaxID=2878201 RepID=A0A9X4IN19_9FLAO|nr:alpha/beta hydrolase [Tenacibaculum larymnensis]MDE1208359.1 alpha/beta hydrolase [Tenacibaculum larymnensis]